MRAFCLGSLLPVRNGKPRILALCDTRSWEQELVSFRVCDWVNIFSAGFIYHGFLAKLPEAWSLGAGLLWVAWYVCCLLRVCFSRASGGARSIVFLPRICADVFNVAACYHSLLKAPIMSVFENESEGHVYLKNTALPNSANYTRLHKVLPSITTPLPFTQIPPRRPLPARSRQQARFSTLTRCCLPNLTSKQTARQLAREL